MDDLEKLIEGYKDGLQGEAQLREFLKKAKHEFFQADVVSTSPNGKMFLWEAKHQSRFKSPPFDGHGLPVWQFQARLKFYENTGIRPILFIVDKETKELFMQFFDVLMKGEKHITQTGKRIIFPLKNFKHL